MSKDLKLDVIKKVRTCQLEKIDSFLEYRYKTQFLGRSITKLYLFANKSWGGGWNRNEDKTIVMLCFEDGSKSCFPVRFSEVTYVYLGINPVARQWHTKETPLDWKLGIDQHYHNLAEVTYGYLDNKILRKIKELNNQENSVVLDLGCGKGRLLKKIEAEGLPNPLFGVDFSDVNIKQAKEDYQGPSIFIEDDVFNVHQIIEEHKLQDQSIIVIAEGLITGGVTKDHFRAVALLQQLAALPNVIHILGGGLTFLSFNSRVAGKIGFNVESNDDKNTEPQSEFFHLSRKTPAEILTRHLKKLELSKKLDLSFSINPHHWLAHDQIEEKIKKAKGKISIDISHCGFTLELQKQIASLASQFPAINWVLYTGIKDVLEKAQQFFPLFPIIKLKKSPIAF